MYTNFAFYSFIDLFLFQYRNSGFPSKSFIFIKSTFLNLSDAYPSHSEHIKHA